MNTEDFRDLIVGIATHQSEELLTNSLLQVIAEYQADYFGARHSSSVQSAGLGVTIARWSSGDEQKAEQVISAIRQELRNVKDLT